MHPVLASSPLVYAHRGASAEVTENTLEAFERAVQLGADVMETDVHLTRDGRLALAHDDTYGRIGGSDKRIAEASWAELRDVRLEGGQRPATLDEALDAFPAVPFAVDVKEDRPEALAAFVRCVRAHGAEERVRLTGFYSSNFRRARALGWSGPMGMARDELLAALFLPSGLAAKVTRGCDAAMVPHRAAGIDFTGRRAIDRLHARGFRVDIWVVDDPDEARELVLRGIDGVVTNDPRRVVPGVRGL